MAVPLTVGMLVLGSCAAPSGPPIPGVILTPTQAARGEQVTATLTGVDAGAVQVFVGDLPASGVQRTSSGVVFTVPPQTPGGPQVVRVVGGKAPVTTSLGVLGDVKRDEVVVLVKPGVTSAQFQARLDSLKLGLTLISFDPLAGPGPCAASLARVGLGAGLALGQTLERLAQSGQEDVILYVDPQSDWALDAPDHLGAIGAYAAQQRNLSGAGVTIAVLDTGVNANSALLGQRLLPGYDFVDEDEQPTDLFNKPDTTPELEGHGTPIAVLAAGARLGVAPAASVLPVRVGDSTGQVLGSQAVRGVCYALQKADPQKLVLNLSFGGDTPVESLKAILDYALKQRVLVAAAAGNQGDGGPLHYPAAFDLPGLLAVAALDRNERAETWVPATFSTRGAYVDIAAPGVGLSSAGPAGSLSSYDGTSFATPLVAGALALWREAQPDATPEQIEKALKNGAAPVPGAQATEVGSGLLDLSKQP